ncbi:MAG: asparagine synthase-related protein [Planctomycetota bacterium]
MPGLILTKALADELPPGEDCAVLARQAAEPIRTLIDCEWTEHLRARGLCIADCMPKARRSAIHVWMDERLAVMLEGYLVHHGECHDSNDARIVAQTYQARGTAGVEELDGSFVIVVVERQRGKVMLWTDRVASRPCFRGAGRGVILVAPELKCFHLLPGLNRKLVPGSLAAMAMNGALMAEHTYYRDVQLIGPARRVTLTNTGVEIKQYWQRTFRSVAMPPSPTEVADCIGQAVRRHLTRFECPILALSGGLDSRIVLAACQQQGLKPAAITWGYDQIDTPGSDFQVGQAAGRLAGLEPRLRWIDVEQLPDYAERVVLLTDGLTGHLGNYPEGDALGRELAVNHDALIRGDEMFGWAAAVDSPRMALRRVGLNVGKRLRLLSFLLRRDVAEGVLEDYRRQQMELLESSDAQADPNDLKDVLYWRTRFPRLIASQAAVFRPHIEVVCPLLDNRVLELVGRLNPAQRVNKSYIAQCTRQVFQTQFALELNVIHSRTSWRRRLRELGPVPRYLVETLLEPQARFDDWFDRTAIRAWLAAATAEGGHLPWPSGGTWLRRLGARARSLALRPTFKERVLLNLVTLKLWLKQVNN